MNNQKGFAHWIIVILISVMAIGLVAAAWYYEADKDNDATTNTASTKTKVNKTNTNIVFTANANSNTATNTSTEVIANTNSAANKNAAPDETADGPNLYTNADCGYSITPPDGWYAHELAAGTLFLQTETLPEIGATEGYAYGTQFGIICGSISEYDGVATPEEYLDTAVGNTDIEGNPIVRENVVRNGLNMVRFSRPAAGAAGTTLTYYHFVDDRYYRLFHWAYKEAGDASQDFEEMVNSFTTT